MRRQYFNLKLLENSKRRRGAAAKIVKESTPPLPYSSEPYAPVDYMLDRLTPEKYTPARSTPERYVCESGSSTLPIDKQTTATERYIPHVPQVTKKFKWKITGRPEKEATVKRVRKSSATTMVGGSGEKKYRCTWDNCTKVFDTSGKLYRHKFYVHKDKVPCPYRSEGCTSMLKPHSVESHVRQVHEKVQVTCSKCGKVMLKDSYYLHKRLHFKDENEFQSVLKTAIDSEMVTYYSQMSSD